MASNLPVIAVRTERINIEKMKIIAKENRRSIGKEAEYIILNYIKAWEKEHGEIKIEAV